MQVEVTDYTMTTHSLSIQDVKVMSENGIDSSWVVKGDKAKTTWHIGLRIAHNQTLSNSTKPREVIRQTVNRSAAMKTPHEDFAG